MKSIFVLALLLASTTTETIVHEFHKLQSQKAELSFVEKYKSYTDISVQAYVLAARMKQLEYENNPFSKLKQFHSYADELDALVKANPDNAHLRYMRLVIQEKTPSLLQYNDEIAEDKQKIQQLLLKDKTLNYLTNYIKDNTSL